MIAIGAGKLVVPGKKSTLEAALALSVATGRAVRWEGYRRGGKPSPGLQETDLETLHLFESISETGVIGGDVGSTTIEFEPRSIRSGRLQFDVSPEASLLPALRAAVVPLARSSEPTELVLRGSSHAPSGDTVEVTSSTWCHLLQRLGIDVSVRLDCAGFAPRGGGEVTCRVSPRAGSEWRGIELATRDELDAIEIVSAAARLPENVSQRQAARARSGVHLSGVEPTVQLVKLRAGGAGSVVVVTGRFGPLPIAFASVSDRGKSSETVGEEAASSFRSYWRQPHVVPDLFVSNFLLFLAFVSGTSSFTTPRLPGSAETHARLIEAFTGRNVDIEGKVGRPAKIRVV